MNFEIDPLLSTNPDITTFGLNVATVWPFPEPVKKAYEKLEAQLKSLDPALYIYPYEETHITVMTLVNFKKHIKPDKDYLKEAQKLIHKIVPVIKEVLSDKKVFTLKFDKITLGEKAVFIQFFDADAMVNNIRGALAGSLNGLNLNELIFSNIVHSTVARFIKNPQSDLEEKFARISSEISLPDFEVKEVLLTTELKPYMRNGKILTRFPLH